MKLTRLEEARAVGAKAHRSGNIGFRYLLTGQEGRADNYALTLVDIPGAYVTPQHRHNFEQVRIMLKGAFGFGPGLMQKEGSVGYFSEGTWYTQDGAQPSQTLLLQCGGPSLSGYMSDRQLQDGIDALSRLGNFHDGVYSWLDADGKKHNQDGYEAVWEHVFARSIKYARARYASPVILDPEHFNWVADPINAGVSTRHLGTFHEHALQLSQLRVEQSHEVQILQTDAGTRLMYCLRGTGALNGQRYDTGTAAEIRSTETVLLRAQATSIFYVIRLPQFPENPDAPHVT